MTTRTTAPLLSWLLLAFACSGRLAFDTHSTGGMGSEKHTDEPEAADGVGASSGSATAGNGAAPPGAGGSVGTAGSVGTEGGSAGTECGGSQNTDGGSSERGADEPHETDPDPDDLPCGEHDAKCIRCRTPADCSPGWLCDPVLRICAECSCDADCPHGATCDERSRRCR